MERNRSERWILFVLLMLLVAVPIMADTSTLEGKGKDEESIPDCEDCEEGGSGCCDPNDLPNGEFKCGVYAVFGCEADDTGGLIDLMLCIEGGVGGWPGDYVVEQIPDGISIEEADGDTVPCIGYRETSGAIGMIRLRNPDSGRVVRLQKFIEAPIGPTSSNPFFTAVYITLNAETFVVATSWGMTVSDLNVAIENAIATKFNITATDDYWIVGTNKQTFEFVELVTVRADDEGIVTMDVELRPVRFNPAQYDISCGESGY